MAAALLRHLGGSRVTVHSAGSAPAGQLNSTVVEVMREVGIDLVADGAHPKLLADESVRVADVVISMGCGDACPVYPGKRYEDWPLDDPAGADRAEVRRIRDEIRSRVEDLLRTIP